MAGWKKYFTPVGEGSQLSTLSGNNSKAGPARTNYSSFLPDVYTGSPNRVDRYQQYEVMDSDPEINAALDILADFCSQKIKDGKSPFNVKWRSKATNSEVRILGEYLQQWNTLQLFDTRIFRIVRNVFKYGDAFFIRDPETQKWSWVDPTKIVKIIVNESDGKAPEQYIIKDLAPNFESLVATQITQNINPRQNGGGATPSGFSGAGSSHLGNSGASATSTGNRWGLAETEHAIDAEHVIHLSLSEGLDNNFPFGNSLLENIFKVYKQKELLEDAILIYRIQRAPERRIFHIDVGNMPSHLAMAFVERVKNEIHQRRIPSQTGGGANVIDSAYNPLCLDLYTKIPLLDGRTLPLCEIIDEFEQGKENWVYSCDPITGEVMPGVIDWAGITRKNTETIKITFDNDEILICTPDHKIPVLGKGFVEAKDLTVNDSLIAFNIKNEKIARGKSNEYQQIWNHKTKSWEWTHRMVGEFFRKKEKHQEFTYLEEHITSVKCTIHHKDSDRFNNDPRNLTFMNKEDHILYHASQKKDFWKTMTPEYRAEMTGKISVSLKKYWSDLSPDDRASAVWKVRNAQKKSVWMRQNDPDTIASYKINAGAARRKTIENNPKLKEQLIKNLTNKGIIYNQSINYTHEMLNIIINIVKTTSKNKIKVLELCDSNIELLDIFSTENPIIKDNQNRIDYSKWGYSKMDDMLIHFGYKNWKDFVKKVELYNHKIKTIEKVENRDTGTITVDGTERWHSHHTFAIASGIFIKNSISEDYFFPMTADGRGSKVDTLPGGCFAMDTKVSLLDGRELSIADIETEMKTGKELWTYSCEPFTGKIVPGLITWAGVTHESAKVMKLTLDNGETIICTPCHKFPQYDQEFKRAGEFEVGDSLIPLYRRHEIMKGNLNYEQVFDNEDKTWKFTHRMVADYLKDSVVKYEVHDETISNGLYEVRHHKDFNRFNNDPTNLCFMSWKDHTKYHQDNVHMMHKHNKNLKNNNPDEYKKLKDKISSGIKKNWANLTDDEYKQRCDAVSNTWNEHTDEEYVERCNGISNGITEYVANLTDEEREIRATHSRSAFKIGNKQFNFLMDNDPAFRQDVIDKRMEYWTPENREFRGKFMTEQNKNFWAGDVGEKRRADQKLLQSVTYTHDMLKAVIDLVKGKTTHEVTLKDVMNELNNNEILLTELTELNKLKKVRNWTINDGFTSTGIVSLIKQFGYSGWKDFRAKLNSHNHRIVAIEYLDDEIEVGTLTIDGDELYHNYHSFALTAGVVSLNSNLGEIDDLKYFTNKLFRGLRIPSSYLPTGADDSQASFNDGRVGTAYIQELRFNKYCERLQSLITAVFDDEFKLYMNSRGANIDSSLFELTFNPPMNFASSKQAAMDTERINTFNTVQAIPYMSKRFAMKRFLGLTEDEMAENERLWGEESGKGQPTHTDAAGEMRSAGLSAAGIEGDMGMSGDLSAPPGMEGDLPPDDSGGAGIAPGTPGSTPGSAPQV